MLTIKRIEEVVTELNNIMFEQHKHNEIYLEWSSIGNENYLIKFLGIIIWHSEDDERLEVYEDVYEDLEVYLIRNIEKICNIVMTINVNP